MNLNELYSRDGDHKNYASLKDDESRQHMSDTRKTRLTLAHINKIRIMNDAREVEQHKKIGEIQAQYRPAPEEPMGPPGF